MANPIAVPGTNVPSGAAVSPGGAQGVTGLAGTPAWTTCTSSFTIPAVGSTVSVPVVDTSWITIGEMIYCDQAGGTGQSGILQVTAKAGNTLTLLNPTPAPAIPPADVTQSGLLKQLSGNTTDFVDGTNTCQNLATAVQPTIWSVRLRSFNATGNPTFEVDQRTAGAGVVNPVGSFVQDRWLVYKAGTMTCSAQQVDAGKTVGTGVVLPGTSFVISNAFHRILLSGQQASLGASDQIVLYQNPEGPQFRELIGDVHSISILARSTVANLTFGCTIKDQGGNKTLSKLCTLGATPLTWQLIQLPNLPVFPAGGNFSSAAGVAGYQLLIQLAAGSSILPPANDTWQNGNFAGAVGQSNFAASAVNSYIDIAMVQHEPGSKCTTPIDCPFTENLTACQRYYSKTYDLATKAGTVTQNGQGANLVAIASQPVYADIHFPQRMAKVPTVTAYSPATGASGNIRDLSHGADVAVSMFNPGETGFGGFSMASPPSAAYAAAYHWTADTGW